MKEKQTYRRFDLPSFLAILGCAGMLLFEGIFIFELYDRGTLQQGTSPSVQTAPVVSQPVLSLPNGSNPPAITPPSVPVKEVPIEKPVSVETNAPVHHGFAEPVEIETAPAAVPVG